MHDNCLRHIYIFVYYTRVSELFTNCLFFSIPVLSVVRVAQHVVYCRPRFVLVSILFWPLHCQMSVLRIKTADYSFGIF
jgi:hypothetical protein